MSHKGGTTLTAPTMNIRAEFRKIRTRVRQFGITLGYIITLIDSGFVS